MTDAAPAGAGGQTGSVGLVMTDPNAEDDPIFYVNDAFQKITLYSADFAVGRNCRFLQGEKTEPEALQRLREGLAAGDEFEVILTNHRADGTPFRNRLIIAPVRGRDGALTAQVGVMRELSATEGDEPDIASLDLLRELQHRVKNHLAMVVGMIRIQANRSVTPESLRAVGRRVEALALLYEEMFQASMGHNSGDTIRAGAYLSRIATVVSRIAGGGAIRLNLDCDEIDLPVDQAARLGLLLSELLTNSYEHAFEGQETGLIEVRFKRLSAGGVRLTVEDDGIGLPAGSDWPHGAMSVERQTERAEDEEGELDTTGHGGRSGVGGSIVVGLTETLGATLDVNRALHGTVVTIDLEGPA